MTRKYIYLTSAAAMVLAAPLALNVPALAHPHSDSADAPAVMPPTPHVTYLGGPTYLIEIGDFRIISDPGFDPQGSQRNEGPGHLLTKVMDPPIPPAAIGDLDIALVSHAQHLDNLDGEGRKLLKTNVAQTFASTSSAELLSDTPNVSGLEPWESAVVTNKSGQSIKITAMPAIHTSDPALLSVVGDVTGYMLEWEGQTNGAFYISGDTVYTKEMEEIGKRYKIAGGILHMGRANVPAVGDVFLTMDGEQGVKAAEVMNIPVVYPAHFEGWRHFPEGSWYIIKDFEAGGVIDKLHLMRPGEGETVPIK